MLCCFYFKKVMAIKLAALIFISLSLYFLHGVIRNVKFLNPLCIVFFGFMHFFGMFLRPFLLFLD